MNESDILQNRIAQLKQEAEDWERLADEAQEIIGKWQAIAIQCRVSNRWWMAAFACQFVAWIFCMFGGGS